MRDSSCIFCKIAGGEIAPKTVYESPEAICFLDLEPKAPGHALVIPRYHAPSLPELPDELVGPLFLAVKAAAGILAEKLGTPDLTIGINQGAAARQGVPHLHVHLLPRFPGDGGGSMHTVFDNPPVSLDDIHHTLTT